MKFFHFEIGELPPAAETARKEVREFIARELAVGARCKASAGDGFSPDFSRRCGEAGLIGMTWPRQYGGRERTFLERYVVTEELLAAGAPVRAHWVADRQSGPLLLKFGSEELRNDILPKIVRGDCYFCVGLSEDDSGSDLFSLRARATREETGWRINGSKTWTSNAHRVHYMIALLRTSAPTEENRRHGLSQFLIPMDAPGITVRPIYNLAGSHDFNEVVFDDVFLTEDHLIGEVDNAWKQATSELAYERSGPERFLETIAVLYELIRLAGESPDSRITEGIGRLVAQLSTLRQMSVSVASMLEKGNLPETEAALVKDLGTCWEQALPDVARDLAACSTTDRDPGRFRDVMNHMTMIAPKLTIQAGTSEIMRSMIARRLGLR